MPRLSDAYFQTDACYETKGISIEVAGVQARYRITIREKNEENQYQSISFPRDLLRKVNVRYDLCFFLTFLQKDSYESTLVVV